MDLFFEELMSFARRLQLPTQELRGKKQSMMMMMMMMTMMMMIHTIHGGSEAATQPRRKQTGLEEALAPSAKGISENLRGLGCRNEGEDEEASSAACRG
jgi:hypothetical protein